MPIQVGLYRIKNHASWTVLDESTDDSRVIHGWQQTDQPNQQWNVQTAESGAYTIQNVKSKSYLHANGPYDGSNLVGYDTISTWYLEQKQSGEVYIIFPGSNRVVDLDNGNKANATKIHLWERNDTALQQQWYFEKI
ncbi:Ricin-type beta-trefoil lectin domain-like [Rhizoctonia solani]|uniref:Ricin-type beta-trefoil lectin domain-like n=1 Tax=Rhizoctonia solani TaxID=456999 RepID=A0A8H7GZN8_9AGAM|nr:Ricin-type beta-trefoil lectin domain-like [Rhizoctonia solani]